MAYVFWHWKRAEVSATEYEGRQRAFHAALAAAPSSGFLTSFSVRLSRAPWAAGGGDGYEDWYLIEDFAALGFLNEAAVSAGRQTSHDAAAVVAAGGAGGLYELRRGAVSREPRCAHWFGKPDGMSYGGLFARLASMVDEGRGALWMRQMVLGPAREFCVHAAAPVPGLAAFDPLVLSLRPAWPHFGER